MPISVTVTPGGSVGPGYQVSLQSTAPGPLPQGSHWDIVVLGGSPSETVLFSQHEEWVGNIEQSILGAPKVNGQIFVPAGRGATDVASRISVNLIDGISQQTVDTGGLANLKWDPQTQLYQQIRAVAQTGGGLTDTESQQLQRIDTNTQEMDTNWAQYTGVTLPSLNDVIQQILSGITVTVEDTLGPVVAPIGDLFHWVTHDFFADDVIAPPNTCTRVDKDASFERYQGVEVHIDSYPPEFHFVTPGGEWSFRDLAVLSFVRGGGLLERHGIHTLSYSVSPLPASLTPWTVGANLHVLPGDYHIVVDWAPGVCGHVIGNVLP